MVADITFTKTGCSPGMGHAPKVLMLMTRNQRRGAESFAAVLAEELLVRGFAVRLRSLSEADGAAIPGVETLGGAELAPRTLWRLRREIFDCDVVVACGSRTLPASVIAGARTGRPIIYQNIGDPIYWAGSFYRRLRVRSLLRHTAAVAALTEQSAAVLNSRFGVPHSQIRVIRNARRSTVFKPATPNEKAMARTRLGLAPDHAVVAVVGALSPEKRIDVAVSAIARLPNQVRLVIAGDGPLRAELQDQADRQIPGRVSFLGPVKDLPELLWASDVLLLTSTTEGVPGVLIEAGLSGLPVVSTDVGYVRDVVASEATGYLVPEGDDVAVAAALEKALEKAPQLGRAARRHCLERFDMSQVSDDWARLIRAVLA